MQPKLRIGTRGSPLALAQANETARRIAEADPAWAAPGALEIVTIRTTGDKMQAGPLAEIGGKGLFTKEIEDALLAEEIDLAVHSMKDVPTWVPEGLVIECILPREDPRDAFISPVASSFMDLPPGAVVGTASLRRSAILLNRRPDLAVRTLRGNVDTRLRKIADGEADATFLALAGLRRLGKEDQVTAIVETDQMLPAVCQGAIGIECRGGDDATRALLAKIDHEPTRMRTIAERALLAGLDGSCRTPIAALAELAGESLDLRALIVRPDGSEIIETTRQGDAADAEAIGADAAAELRARGGSDFFDAPE